MVQHFELKVHENTPFALVAAISFFPSLMMTFWLGAIGTVATCYASGLSPWTPLNLQRVQDLVTNNAPRDNLATDDLLTCLWIRHRVRVDNPPGERRFTKQDIELVFAACNIVQHVTGRNASEGSPVAFEFGQRLVGSGSSGQTLRYWDKYSRCNYAGIVLNPYEWDKAQTPEQLATLIHELCHGFSFDQRSKTDGWLRIWLAINKSAEWVSGYAKTNCVENFAEAFTAFVLDPDWLSRYGPLSYRYLARIYPNGAGCGPKAKIAPPLSRVQPRSLRSIRTRQPFDGQFRDGLPTDRIFKVLEALGNGATVVPDV